MNVREQDGQIVVDHGGSGYFFEPVEEDKLQYMGRGGTNEEILPNEVVEELESRGYEVTL